MKYTKAPATIEEYNSLAPKRQNPVLEDAIDDIMKHKVLSQFRNKFLDFLETKTEVVRGNTGTEKRPIWEKDSVYMDRVVASVITKAGGNPSDAAAQKAVYDNLFADAERILNEQAFNVAEREPGDGPSVAKTYTEWATTAIKTGKAAQLIGLLNKQNNRSDALTGDEAADTVTLAKAIAANEKRKRDIETAAAKAEYGLSDVAG